MYGDEANPFQGSVSFEFTVVCKRAGGECIKGDVKATGSLSFEYSEQPLSITTDQYLSKFSNTNEEYPISSYKLALSDNGYPSSEFNGIATIGSLGTITVDIVSL